MPASIFLRDNFFVIKLRDTVQEPGSIKRRRIARVLTWGFATILGVNLLVLVSAFFSQQSLRTTQNHFLGEVLPELTRTSEMVEQASRLVHTTQDVVDANTTHELNRAEDDALLLLGSLRSLGATTSVDIQQRLSDVATQLEEILQIQARYVAQRETIRQAIEDIDEILQALEIQIIDLSYANIRSSEYGEINSAMARWPTLFSSLDGDQSEASIQDLRQTLLLQLRRATRTLGKQGTPETSDALLALMEQVYNESGVVAAALRAAKLSAARDQALARMRGITTQLGTRLLDEEQTLTSQAGVESSNLQRRAITTQTLLVVLGLVSVAVAVVFVVKFVRAGVAIPLLNLAERTDRLARGEHIEHADSRYHEFHQIERALDVFAENAEELRIAKREVEQKNTNLRRAVEDLERFSYAVSHDLRSPLRGIRTLASFIEEDLPDPPEDIAKNLQRIQERTTNLEHMLEDLLSYSRHADVENSLEKITLAETVRDQLSLLEFSEHVTLELDLSVCEISVPKVAFEQVLRNLLDNAIKHHPSVRDLSGAEPAADKPILINVRSVRADNRVLVEVSDNGEGVPADYMQKMQGLFQTMGAKNGSRKSSGLGLALVSRIASQMGGALSMRGNEQGGLCVSISLPGEMAA